MSRDDILNMPVGRELDTLVAVKFSGWWSPIDGIEYLPRYSKNISAAWEVVEKIKTQHDMSIHSDNSEKKGYHVMITEYGTVRRLAQVFAETAPLAISRAALLAVME